MGSSHQLNRGKPNQILFQRRISLPFGHLFLFPSASSQEVYDPAINAKERWLDNGTEHVPHSHLKLSFFNKGSQPVTRIIWYIAKAGINRISSCTSGDRYIVLTDNSSFCLPFYVSPWSCLVPFFFFFFWLYPWHVEVDQPGI